MPQSDFIRRPLLAFTYFWTLILAVLVPGPATASVRPQPERATLKLKWSVPEPVLRNGRVTRLYVHRSVSLTVTKDQRDTILRSGTLKALRPALTQVYGAVESRQPRDIRFVRSGSGWVAQARTGWRVDRTGTEQQVLRALVRGDHSSRMQIKLMPPQRSVAWAARQGVQHLASGASTFTGSPDFRVHNLRLGASRIDGIWLAPGETFDFNARLGPVSARNGFLPGYVVTGNTLSVEDGGGVCQVSTTVFRAALLGGFPIVERHAHSYQVGYYGEPGQDAAVYAPAKNLRWQNDTRHPVLVQASWDTKAAQLQVHLFGGPNARRVWVGQPQVTGRLLPPPPTFVADRESVPGTVRRIDMPVPGSTVKVVRQVRDQDGRIRRETFRSTYRPWGGVFAVSPGDSRLQRTAVTGP